MSDIKSEIDLERAEVHDQRLIEAKRRDAIKQFSIYFLIFELFVTGALLAFFPHGHQQTAQPPRRQREAFT